MKPVNSMTTSFVKNQQCPGKEMEFRRISNFRINAQRRRARMSQAIGGDGKLQKAEAE